MSSKPSNVDRNGRIKKGWSKTNTKPTHWERLNELVVSAGEAIWSDEDGNIVRLGNVKEDTNEST